MPAWFWRNQRDRLDSGDRLCGYACNQEPECVTFRPRRGWPPYRTRALLARALDLDTGDR